MEEEKTNEKQIGRFGKIIKKAKNISIIILCTIVILGSIGLFVASIASNNCTIDTLSSFIGIVLGMVALVTSIVSMILSFYSIEKSAESEKDLNNLLSEMKSIQKNTERIVSRIDKKQDSYYAKNISNTTTKDVGNERWSEVDKNGKN